LLIDPLREKLHKFDSASSFLSRLSKAGHKRRTGDRVRERKRAREPSGNKKVKLSFKKRMKILYSETSMSSVE